MPEALEILIAADKQFTVSLFGMLAGLALTASAFSLTAVSVLEDAIAKRLASIIEFVPGSPGAQQKEELNSEAREAAGRLSEAKDSVLGAGPKLIAGMFCFVGGLAVSLELIHGVTKL